MLPIKKRFTREPYSVWPSIKMSHNLAFYASLNSLPALVKTNTKKEISKKKVIEISYFAAYIMSNSQKRKLQVLFYST